MQSPRRAQLYGILAMVGCIICWGAVPVLLRQLTSVINPWTANGVRYPAAAILYWPVLILAWSRGQLTWRLVKRTMTPALFAWLGQVFWGLAPYYLPASAIGFYVRFSLVTALGVAMVLFPDERRLLFRPVFYVGLLLVIVGFVGFSFSGGMTHDRVVWTGILIMLACAFFFGLYGVSVRYFLMDVNPILGFAIVSQFVSIGTFGGLLLMGDAHRLVDLESADWARLVASTILGISLGHIFMYTAVQRLGAAISSSVQMVMPFVTAVLAAVVLKEHMGGWQWVAGVTMVFGATLLVTIEQRLLQHPERAEEIADRAVKPSAESV